MPFFSDILSDFKTCFGLQSQNNVGRLAITLHFLTSRQHVFRLWFHALQFTLRNVAAKACNRR